EDMHMMTFGADQNLHLSVAVNIRNVKGKNAVRSKIAPFQVPFIIKHIDTAILRAYYHLGKAVPIYITRIEPTHMTSDMLIPPATLTATRIGIDMIFFGDGNQLAISWIGGTE